MSKFKAPKHGIPLSILASINPCSPKVVFDTFDSNYVFFKKRALFNEASDRPNSNSRHNMKFEFVPATTSCKMITVDEANDEIT